MPRAPRPCNERGCSNLIRGHNVRYCEVHRAAHQWQGGKRPDRPHTAARDRLRAETIERAHGRCQIQREDRCIGIATQVDRIDYRGGYEESNCQAACEPCHGWKSSMEAHHAKGDRNELGLTGEQPPTPAVPRVSNAIGTQRIPRTL